MPRAIHITCFKDQPGEEETEVKYMILDDCWIESRVPCSLYDQSFFRHERWQRFKS